MLSLTMSKETNFDIYYIISRIFDPIILPIVLFFLLGWYFELKLIHQFLIFAIQIGIPTSLIIIDIRKGLIDIDITKREKRIKYLITATISTIIATIMIYLFQYEKLFIININLVFIALIFSFITFFWKISGHALVFVISISLLANIIHPMIYLLGAILLPIVCIARYKQKKHTISQLTAGSILGIIQIGILHYLDSIFQIF